VAAGSVVARRTRLPSRARRTARAHAATVFPTPPLPVRTTVLLPQRGHHLPQNVRGREPREGTGPRESVVEGIFLAVEGDGGEPPQEERPFTSPAWSGTSMQGRPILPERRRTCSPWDDDRVANGPPAPAGITPFTTIGSCRSRASAALPRPEQLVHGGPLRAQTSVNSVSSVFRSAAMAWSYFALAP